MKITTAERDLALAELCRRDLRWFVRAAWPHFEPGQPFVEGWHIDAICEHLEALFRGQIRKLIVNVPPRTCKSSINSVLFPAWCWLPDPTFSFVTASYEYSLAARDSVRTRRLMDTPFYARLNRTSEEGMPKPIFRLHDRGVRALARLKDTEAVWENDMGGYRIAVGVEGGMTGKGARLTSVDDPQTPDQASSEAERIHALTWWDATMSTRFVDPKTDRKLITMQRLHCFDLTGHEISKNLGYVHLKLPMEFDPRRRCVTSLGVDKDGETKTWQDPRTEEGELLWPARYGEDEVRELKQVLGPWQYAAQMTQEPLPEGGGILNAGWFMRFSGLPKHEVCAISVDCAFTDAQTSSYVVIQAWIFAGPNAYLVDQVRAHLDFTKTVDEIKAMRLRMRQRKTPPSAILVENKANGPAVINSLVKTIPGVEPMEPRKMGGSKEARASAIAPFVKSGNVFLPEGAPWLAEFLLEVGNFPRYRSDDQVDAMSQALFWRFLQEVDIDAHRRKNRFIQWSGLDDPS